MSWARLLYVGDVLFNLKKIEVSAQDEDVPDDVRKKGTEISCIEIEYRLRGEPIITFYYFDSELERDDHFEKIDERELRGILMKEIE